MFTASIHQLDHLHPSQTIIIPAYNEGQRISATIDTICSFMQLQDYAWELIVVDDGSSDDTAENAKEAASSFPQAQVLTIPHMGKAAAVRAGVDASTKDLLLFTDADLSTPIDFLISFRDAIRDGADLVIGSREDHGAVRIGEPAFRHTMGRIFNGLVRLLLLPELQDTQCGFKLFRRCAALDIFSAAQRHQLKHGEISGPRVTAFDVELLLIAYRRGYNIESLPVTWTFGENSKVNPLADTVTNVSDIVAIKWNDLRGRYD